MPKKYIKLGTIKKRRGIQLYEYQFNEEFICDGNTDVFVKKQRLATKKSTGRNMKTIQFTCHGNNAPAYSCSEPGDNSGRYVSFETAQAMRNLITDLHASLRAINTVSILSYIEEQRKAIGV